jgi:type IV secretion system protein VirB2
MLKLISKFNVVPVCLMATLALLTMAEPSLAQAFDTSPIQEMFQGLVDAITGPLGLVIATLVLAGLFLSWMMGWVDMRQALWILIGIIGLASAATIAGAIWG